MNSNTVTRSLYKPNDLTRYRETFKLQTSKIYRDKFRSNEITWKQCSNGIMLGVANRDKMTVG